MQRFILFIFFWLLTLLVVDCMNMAYSQGQKKALDSLLSQLSETGEDTNRVNTLNNLAYSYYTIDPNIGLNFAEQALALSTKLNWKKGVASSYTSIGSNYWGKRQFLLAQDYYFQNLQITKELGDLNLMQRSYHNIGISYGSLQNFTKAIYFLKLALKVAEQLRDIKAETGYCHNIGDTYIELTDWDSAFAYHEKALKLAETINYQKAIYYSNLKLGYIYTQWKQWQKADSSLIVSQKVAYSLNDTLTIGFSWQYKGELYQQKGEFSKAAEYFKTSAFFFQELGGLYAITFSGITSQQAGNSYYRLAVQKSATNSYQSNQLLRQAISLEEKAISLSQLSSDWQNMSVAQETIYKCYFLLEDYKNALENFQQYISYRDSASNLEREKEKIQHEVNLTYRDSVSNLKKASNQQILLLQKESQLQKKQNWIYFIIVLSITGAFSAFLLYRNTMQRIQIKNELQTEKLQKELNETEYQKNLNELRLIALHTQMNPHFIFNTLNTLQSFIYSNDKSKASLYLGMFSELMRRILDYSQQNLITIEDELELIRLYTEIEKARFSDDLSIEIVVSPSLELYDIYIPPLLVQPFVENAIKHGLLHKQGEKKLLIEIRPIENDIIQIIVDDNGIGRKKSAELNATRSNHNSFANAANEKRIELINYLSKNTIGFNVTDKTTEDGYPTGTKIIFSISKNSKASNAQRKNTLNESSYY